MRFNAGLVFFLGGGEDMCISIIRAQL